AQIYTSILCALTTAFTALALFGTLGRVSGGIFIAVFVLYLFSIGYAIYRGVLDAPDESDDDCDDETLDNDEEQAPPEQVPTETSALVPSTQPSTTSRRRSLFYHIVQLI